MSDEQVSPRFAWIRNWWQRLSHEQQTGVLIFGVCGCAALLFSGWYLRAQIRAPFLASRAQLQASRNFVNNITRERQAEEVLRTKDTDGDGLNDWDELNTYKTSPYLADSDSDALSDSIEISQGQDPNCPKDRECQVRLDGIAQARSGTSTGQTLLQATAGAALPPPNGSEVNAAQIRQFLISNQLATDADLRGLSDQALVELYRRAAAGTQSSPTPSSNTLSSPGN